MNLKKILAFGLLFFSDTLVCNPNDLDTSFNNTGFKSFAVPGSTSSQANALAVQIDGKLVIGGQAVISGVTTAVLARYHENGDLDTTFNAPNGFITFPVSLISGATMSQFNRIALQIDGKILVVGVTTPTKYLLARYNTNGTIDTSFNTTGYYSSLFTGSASESYGLAIQPDGKCIVVGTLNNNQILVVRHNLNGSLDTSFGSPNGYVLPANTGIANGFTGWFGTFLVQLQSDEKIVVSASSTISPSTQSQITILRFLTDGTLDPSFGTGGIVATNIGYRSIPNALSIQPNNEILITGRTVPTNTATNQFFVAKYNTDGSLDTSFGYPNGYVTLQPSGWSNAQAWGIYAEQNGQIIATGQATIAGLTNFAAIRFNADGSLNDSINPSGYFTNNFGTGVTVYDTALQFITGSLQFEAKLVFVGKAVSGSSFFTARFLGGVIPRQTSSELAVYGLNGSLLDNFLYIQHYAQVINNPIVQASVVMQVNAIINTYITTYANQPNFNYIAYLYLIDGQLNNAQASLILTYPTSSVAINQFFSYLNNRIALLMA